MSDPLVVYLQDHLAGSVQAVELVEFLRDQHHREALRTFAAEILTQIKAGQPGGTAKRNKEDQGLSGLVCFRRSA
jgi:hypothetical protein